MAAEACRLRIVQVGIHSFRPHGMTGYALLMESHISIHTWPESRFALVDVLSCSELDLLALDACFRDALMAENVCLRTEGRRTADPDLLKRSAAVPR